MPAFSSNVWFRAEMRQSQRVILAALPGTTICFQPVPSHTGQAVEGCDEGEVTMVFYENTTIRFNGNALMRHTNAASPQDLHSPCTSSACFSFG
jgi:hypothetical protein